MSASAVVDPVDKGCPSGLEPAAPCGDGDVIDPSPFVERKNGDSQLLLSVFGARCAGCIAKIETAVAEIPGVEAARLNLSTGRLAVSWKADAVSPRAVAARLVALGYRVAPFDPAEAGAEHDAEGRRLLRALAVAGFAAANVMLLSISIWSGGLEMGPATRGLMHWASAVIATPAALYAGRPFFSSAWRALRAGHANMDVPISLAVILALTLSVYEFYQGGEHAYFDAAVMLLFFLLIGRYLDHRLRWRARSAARDLIALQATTASVIGEDGVVRPTSTRDLEPGDRILLSPGDRAPVDGVVTEGRSTVDVSIVTGESAPAQANQGETIRAGTLNQSDRLVMRATATRENSLIADLVRLIEAGEQSKSRYVRLADKAAALYVPIVHSLAAITFAAWFFVIGAGFHAAVLNAIAVLIITCPCALGLAAPAVQIVATGRLFRAGVLVKSGDALERLAEADAIVFDKTGTLTLGRPRLANRKDISDPVLEDAAALARTSRHPLSRAIVEAAGDGPLEDGAVEFPGLGVEATVGGARRRLGAADWVGAPASGDDALEAWYRNGEAEPVRFVFADPLRADASDVVRGLKDRGLTVSMISGDREEVAAAVAGSIGVEDWRARAAPQDKVRAVDSFAQDGVRAAMIGDGLNDAPALAAAHVSLSPGSAADASQAAADFVYQGDGLSAVGTAVDVSRSARRRILENYAFAAVYNACAVPLAALGFVTPLIAALAMSGSSLVVTLNALRAGAPRGSVR